MAEYPFADGENLERYVLVSPVDGQSFPVVSKWIDNHLWPQSLTDGQQAVLVVSGLARDFGVFKFRSAVSYFEVMLFPHYDYRILLYSVYRKGLSFISQIRKHAHFCFGRACGSRIPLQGRADKCGYLPPLNC